MLPAELVTEILYLACRMPRIPPVSYGDFAGLAGVADITTTTNLMCVSRHFYDLLAPLLYRAPLILYRWQLTRFHRTLERRPQLAPLVEHIFVGRGEMIPPDAPRYPAEPIDYMALCGIVRGAEFPLHYGIEREAMELSYLPYLTYREPHVCSGYFVPSVMRARKLIAWLRCVAAYGARYSVHTKNIPGLEARAPVAIAWLNGQDQRRHHSTRWDWAGPSIRPITLSLLDDLGAKAPALYKLLYSAYMRLSGTLPRSLRFVAALALAYGQLKGAANARAYKAYLAADHDGVWRGRDEAAEPWTAQFRGVPDTHFDRMFDLFPLAKWYSVTPGIRISPAPHVFCTHDLRHAICRVLWLTTNVRTLAIPIRFLNQLCLPYIDVLPRLDKLIVNHNCRGSLSVRNAIRGPLTRVRELVSIRGVFSLAELYRHTRPGNILRRLERNTHIYADGYVRIDRAMLDALDSEHVDAEVLHGFKTMRIPVSQDALVRALGAVPTITDDERARLDALRAYAWDAPHYSEDMMAFLEWLRAAA